MANIVNKDNHKKNRIHVLARWVGTIVGSIYLLILVTPEELNTNTNSPGIEGMILGGLIIIAIAGIVIAWWREGVGGTIVTVTAIALCVFGLITAGRMKIIAALFGGGPFLLVGILFLISFWRSRKLEIT